MLTGHRLLQVWQYKSQAEKTYTDVLDVAARYGYTGVVIKALDGEHWMGEYDPNPYALEGIQQVRSQVNSAHERGLLYCCWTNPLYHTPSVYEPDLTGQIAKVVDALFLDVEPYSQFWSANRPVGTASRFMQQVRTNAPDAYIVLQPDPRPARLQEIRIEEWLPYIDAIAGQHYWNDFQVSVEHELSMIQKLAAKYGKPIIPTLPGNAAPVDLLTITSQLTQWVAWRLGSMDKIQLGILGASRINVAAIRNAMDNLWAYTERIRQGEILSQAHIDDMQHRLIEIKRSIGLV